jgi:hypothetical protein
MWDRALNPPIIKAYGLRNILRTRQRAYCPTCQNDLELSLEHQRVSIVIFSHTKK